MSLVRYIIEEVDPLVGDTYQRVTAFFSQEESGLEFSAIWEITGRRSGNDQLQLILDLLERLNGRQRDLTVKRIIKDRY